VKNHFSKIRYSKLDARQKENFNYQWISGAMATYGYHTYRIPDDWLGADFIARNMKTGRKIKVQLKGRMHFAKKYIGKNIWIAFRHKDRAYCYPHDKLLNQYRSVNPMRISKAWNRNKREVHWPAPTKIQMKFLAPYEIQWSLA
jgi:hypothetical protein